MLGDPIRVKVSIGDLWYSYFKTKISQSCHVLADPQFECFEYTEDDSYYDCITLELQDLFDRELGCVLLSQAKMSRACATRGSTYRNMKSLKN